MDSLTALEWIRSVVRLSIRYRVSTGLRRDLMDLPGLKRFFESQGKEKEAFQVDLVSKYLELEENIARKKNENLVSAVMNLRNSHPIGTIVSFKYQGLDQTGEIIGFLADRVLVVKETETHRYIYEVFPNDIEFGTQ